MILALVTLGENARAFGGFDYLASLESHYDAVTGKYDDGMYADALAALAVVAVRKSLPERAGTYIALNQCPDGGFAHDACAQGSDVDTTAMALLVLQKTDASGDAATKALAFLRAARNADDGWGQHARDGATNTNSTALAISALSVAGETPALDGLLALQLPGGDFRFSAATGTSNDYSTVQAIPALLRQGYPVKRGRPVTVNAAPASDTQAPVPATSASRSAAPRAASRCRPGDGLHHATLVVVFGDNVTKKICVAFSERRISGLELVERSGIGVVYQDAGGGSVFVCSIGGQGRDYPRESCIPPCPSRGACAFWGYYALQRGTWRFSELGAATRMLADGDTDGWRYGMHDSTSGGCAPDAKLQPDCGAPVAYVRTPDARETKTNYAGFGALGAALMLMAAAAFRITRGRREEP